MSPETITLIDLPRGRLSPSAADTWKRCGEQYRRRYILRQKGPMDSGRLLGTVVHAAIHEATMQQFGMGKRPLPEESAKMAIERVDLELARAQSETGLPLVWKNDMTIEKIKKISHAMTLVYEEQVGVGLHPALAEREIELRYEGVDWVFPLRIDILTKQGVLIDVKTGMKHQNQMTVVTSSQLTRYQMALESIGERVMALEIHSISWGEKKGATVKRFACAPRTKDQMADEWANLLQIAKGIRAEVFPKANNWQVCSWCEHLAGCQPREWVEAALAAEQDKETVPAA